MPRQQRPSARIVLYDDKGRVLLFRFTPPDRPAFWCTPGGALDPGETYEDAARRELREETGLACEPGTQIARKIVEFETLEGVAVIADERYFRVRCPGGATIDTRGHTELERAVMCEWRWFSAEDLATLDEPWFPEDLASLICG